MTEKVKSTLDDVAEIIRAVLLRIAQVTPGKNPA